MNHTFANNIDGPSSMTILDDVVFWTTSHSDIIHWAVKHSPDSVKQLTITRPSFMSNSGQLHLLVKTPNMVVDHICQRIESPCSHICVPIGDKAIACVCPIGMVFKDFRNETCIDAENCDLRYAYFQRNVQ